MIDLRNIFFPSSCFFAFLILFDAQYLEVVTGHKTLKSPGLHNLRRPGSRAVRKWRENERMKRKWGENEEIEREWRDFETTLGHFGDNFE